MLCVGSVATGGQLLWFPVLSKVQGNGVSKSSNGEWQTQQSITFKVPAAAWNGLIRIFSFMSLSSRVILKDKNQ